MGNRKKYRVTICTLISAIVMLTITAVFANEMTFSREEFCNLIIEILEKRAVIDDTVSAGQHFSDTYNPNVQKAYEIGIIQGNEKGEFHPEKEISSQDAAVILKRLQDYIAPQLIYDTAKEKKGKEWEKIKGYAASSIAFLSMTDVIPNGAFHPEEPLEEGTARAMIEKIFENRDNQPMAKPGVLPKRKVPVLMYHVIGNPPSEKSPYGYLCVSPEAFDQQMKYLKQQGYTFLFPNEIYYADSCHKPIIVTFDDGYDNNYYWAYRIAKKYNAKITIYMVGDYLDKPGYLSSVQLREMTQSRIVNIGSHTMSHKDLSLLNSQELKYEFEESKRKLEQAVGKEIMDISYPFGKFSAAVIEEAKKYYKNAFTVLQEIPGSAFGYARIVIPRGMDIPGLQANLSKFQ